MISPKPLAGLAAALAVTLFPSCENQTQVNQLQSEIRTLNDQHTQVSSELNRLKMQINALSKERDTLKQENGKLETELDGAHKSLEQLQKDFNSYRSQYKVGMRSKAPGMSLGSLIADGTTYQQVKIREVTDDALSIIYEGGFKKLAWHSVPDAVRKTFGIEKPGEYVSYVAPKPSSEVPLTRDQKIARRDKEIENLQRQLVQLRIELDEATKAKQNASTLLVKAQQKNLKTTDLERAKNLFDVKIMKLEADKATLESKQKELMHNSLYK